MRYDRTYYDILVVQPRSHLLYISQYLIRPSYNCYYNTHSVCLSYTWCCKREAIWTNDHSQCLLVECRSLFLHMKWIAFLVRQRIIMWPLWGAADSSIVRGVGTVTSMLSWENKTQYQECISTSNAYSSAFEPLNKILLMSVKTKLF